MLDQQQQMILSPYLDIYDIVIPNDHLLRQINEMVDFSFIYEELTKKYCLDNGRRAIDPVRMFKYLLLKVIDPSSLTKFRKQRLKDASLLDMLIGKTVTIALEKGIIKSKSIIVDATHTKARYNHKRPEEVLNDLSKKLRKSVYEIDESMRNKFPRKLNAGATLNEIIEYNQRLIQVVEQEPVVKEYPKVKTKVNLLKETIDDDLDYLDILNDPDAKIGHKTADSSFFGYKTHIAMTEERIITSAVVTSGEKNDEKQLKALTEKSIEAGMKIENIIGDAAYSEKGNIEFARDKGIKLVSKLNPSITQGCRHKEDSFDFNKDAGMYICKSGHQAIRKAHQGTKNQNKNQVSVYYFDVEKCKVCPIRQGCYKDGAKTKSYSVTIKSQTHSEQAEFQETEYFKEKSKHRYKIEAKNSELKHAHGYDVAYGSGIKNMQIQGALSIFAVNLKRIMKLSQ